MRVRSDADTLDVEDSPDGTPPAVERARQSKAARAAQVVAQAAAAPAKKKKLTKEQKMAKMKSAQMRKEAERLRQGGALADAAAYERAQARIEEEDWEKALEELKAAVGTVTQPDATPTSAAVAGSGQSAAAPQQPPSAGAAAAAMPSWLSGKIELLNQDDINYGEHDAALRRKLEAHVRHSVLCV